MLGSGEGGCFWRKSLWAIAVQGNFACQCSLLILGLAGAVPFDSLVTLRLLMDGVLVDSAYLTRGLCVIKNVWLWRKCNVLQKWW